ncbi:MAG: hypothetical protein WC802_03690 [Patescibacteria group bacterium]|jgi:hypothetical protein
MPKKNFEGAEKPFIEQAEVKNETLSPEERRGRMLEEAEKLGVTTETLALLSMVGVVQGFTNMEAVYRVPDRNMIEAEQVKGAKSESHGRARAWRHLRDGLKGLDNETRETNSLYYRPSDWARLFSALKKASNPGNDVPDVFSVKSPADRAVFRQWAEQYALNGDGLVRTAQVIRDEYEEKTGQPFDRNGTRDKIQAFTGEQLNAIVRAGFADNDTYIHHEGEFVPLQQMPQLFDQYQLNRRRQQIKSIAEARLQKGTYTQAGRDELLTEIALEYDRDHFGALQPDRRSVASEIPIIGGVFATVAQRGKETIGSGFHGIIEPEVLKMVKDEYVYEDRSKPYVSQNNGKTVVSVTRSLFARNGVGLMPEEEPVVGQRAELLAQEATRKIADAIVYDRYELDRRGERKGNTIGRPYYWLDVHWVYKRLTEQRLPFLAKLAHVDTGPLSKFTDEEAEKEWMYSRILSSGATTETQLNDLQKHFELTIGDVYPEDKERTALEETAKEYPEVIRLGRDSFLIQYEWSADQQSVARAIIEIQAGFGFSGATTYKLKDVVPAQIPQLGSKEHPLEIVFRYILDPSVYWSSKPTEYPANRLRELLELIEPNEQFMDRKWRDFKYTEAGKMDVPLSVTAKDHFPTNEEIDMLLAPHPESVVYVTDRNGKEHSAYATIRHAQGDEYHLCYAENKKRADELLETAMDAHAKRQGALKAREAMGGEFNEKLVEVRKLQQELEAYNKEFETDNLVAFVLADEPFSGKDKKYVQNYLDVNDIEHAQVALGNCISRRKGEQRTIDGMRAVAKVIEELETLGFNWHEYEINKRSRDYSDDDDYGGYSQRRDAHGFSPGDIRLNKHQIYHPSMGRIVGQNNGYLSTEDLLSLQGRLEHELFKWNQKKEALREARAQSAGSAGAGGSEPEVIRRGKPKAS